MTKYVCVKLVPDRPLDKDECVIGLPDFVQDVQDCRCRRPNTGLLSAFYMRSLADHIGHKYDPQFPGSGHIVVNDYNGVPFKTIEDVAKTVTKMFRRYYPQIFDAYVEHQIKNKPFGVKLVYFVGDHADSGSFSRNGIDAIDEKDVDVYMGRKEKKPNKGSFKKIEDKVEEVVEDVGDVAER